MPTSIHRTDLERNAAAHVAGYIAAKEGRSRAPAADRTCMELIAELDGPIGASLPVLRAFCDGYQARCNEEAAAVLSA